jgi:hypothetical protein
VPTDLAQSPDNGIKQQLAHVCLYDRQQASTNRDDDKQESLQWTESDNTAQTKSHNLRQAADLGSILGHAFSMFQGYVN